MDDIKKSKNLEAVIREACNLGDGQKGVFTAEKFLYFLVNLIEIGKTWSSKELSDALEILKKHILSIENVRRLLKIYINRDNQDVFRDLAYMGQMMALAWNDVKGLTVNGEPVGEVTISILLVKILKYPNDTIKNILNCDLNNAVRVDVTKSDMSDDEAGSDKLKPADHKVMKDIPKVEPVKDKKLQNNTETGNSEKVGMSQFVADAKRIREYLQGKVYGQENAVNVFIKGFFQASMLSAFDKERNRPRASFLFAGPPGVGKTFLAETAADALGLKFRRFDMSEYCDKEASIEFCGSDGVYKNNKKGNFTSFIMDNPKCVVLLDEIEKAHISIIHLFLQVLDAGRLRDSNTDEEVSFKDVILIFTTNAGKQLYTDSEYEDLSTIPRNVIINALEKDINPQTKEPYFPAAICSRFASGNVVMFNHIGASDLRLIAKKEIEERAESLEKETGIQMEIDESVYTSLLFSEGIKADARTTKGRAEAFFNEELYELLRLVSSDKAKTSIDQIEKIKISVGLNNISDDIKELFTLNSGKNMLVLAGKDTVELCEKRKPACTIIGVQTSKDAIEAIKKNEIDLILLDVTFGLSASEKLNIEDENSPARELLGILHEQKNSIPLYLLDYAKNPLDAEEKISFARQGVRGFLQISSLASFKLAETLNEILATIHQQASMMNLARENKLVSFETSQSISKNGKLAEIKLFDFKKIVAVDAEDSKSILNPVSRPDVHFDDVIGADEAKKELAYFVGYMKNPKKYLCTGVKAPKGVLLYGPPGTGKTMLAKAMASEAGVTFIAAEGNQFAKKYVGEGPESVHALFAKARKYAPSILFIDEIDAIAKERRGTDSSADEATLTAFLTEMDGFKSDSTKPVFVLAATNFEVEPGKPKSLDPALMRRFDRRVYIELPNKEDRVKFLKMKLSKNRALQISERELANIAVRSTGMSLAELDSVVELSLRSAIRKESTVVTDEIFDEAFEAFNGGEVKPWDTARLERIARHEAGHAFLCWLSGETPSYLTIVARGDHGGYMQHSDNEGRSLYTKKELLDLIRTSLGGRAAEIVFYGEQDGLSTGASGDLQGATDMAYKIVCNYGMDPDVGMAVIGGSYSEGKVMPVKVRNAVNRILNEQMQAAVNIISQNKGKVDSLVKVLISENHLNGAEIDEVLRTGKLRKR